MRESKGPFLRTVGDLELDARRDPTAPRGAAESMASTSVVEVVMPSSATMDSSMFTR